LSTRVSDSERVAARALSHQAGYGRALVIVALLPLGGAVVALGQRPDVTRPAGATMGS